MTQTSPNLAVAGAGIGGLSASLCATMAGFQVHLFEQATEFSEVGAGIQMGPNVWHCLNDWGIEASVREWAAFPLAIQARDAASNKLLGQFELGAAIERRYGAPYATIHRADLHQVLLQQVRNHTSITITASTPIASFKQDESAVQLCATGQQELGSFDALIAADGVWSRLRQQLLGDGLPTFTGHCAYRGLIRQNALPQQMRTQLITTWLGNNMHAVLYPIRGGEWLNMVVIFNGLAGIQGIQTQSAEESWDLQAPPEQLQHLLKDECPALRNMVDAISAHGTSHQGAPWRMWPLYGRSPVRNANQMSQGRIALLGDAAHPMLPYLAQGAAMAIEDAQQLRQSLSMPGGDIPSKLSHYAKARYRRNARVQQKSARNGYIFHLSGPLRACRDASLRLLGGHLMDTPWLYSAR